MKRVCAFAVILFALAAAPARAGVTVTVRPGGWSDVVKAPDGFLFVRATVSDVVTERPDGTLRWQVRLPEPILYLRAAVDAGGTVMAIAQGNGSGLAYAIGAAGVTGLATSFGQNATAIAWSAARGFVYYVQTSPTSYVVYDSAGCTPCLATMSATSQGFRDIQPDGTVRRGDDYFTAPFNGRQLWEYAQRGDVTVGQCDPAGICAAVDGKTFTILPGDGFEPHLAVDGRTFAVAVRAPGGAALIIVAPPYPPADVLPPSGGPRPVPAPAPAPAPPVPVPPVGGTVPDESATVKAVADQNAALMARLRAFAPDCHTDADPACAQVSVLKGEMTRRIAWACYQHDHRWGLRLKPSGTNALRPSDGVPLSTDVLMWKDDGQIVDVMSDRDAGWSLNPADHQPVDQWVEPLPEVTNSGPVITMPPATPAPSPVPTPTGVTRAELDAAIASIRSEVQDVDQRLSGIDSRTHSQIWDVMRRVDALEAKPLDLTALQAAIEAALVNYEVNGKTKTDRLGLQHVVQLPITRKK